MNSCPIKKDSYWEMPPARMVATIIVVAIVLVLGFFGYKYIVQSSGQDGFNACQIQVKNGLPKYSEYIYTQGYAVGVLDTLNNLKEEYNRRGEKDLADRIQNLINNYKQMIINEQNQ